MPGELISLDPVSEDATNAQFDFPTANPTVGGIALLEHVYATPDRDQLFAASADTEGDPFVQSRYRNRKLTYKLRVYGSSATDLHSRLAVIQQKVGKIAREGGTLKRTTPSGLTIVFDLLDADIDVSSGYRFVANNRATVDLIFLAKPFG